MRIACGAWQIKDFVLPILKFPELNYTAQDEVVVFRRRLKSIYSSFLCVKLGGECKLVARQACKNP